MEGGLDFFVVWVVVEVFSFEGIDVEVNKFPLINFTIFEVDEFVVLGADRVVLRDAVAAAFVVLVVVAASTSTSHRSSSSSRGS